MKTQPKNLRILILEDEPDDFEVVTNALRRDGLDCDTTRIDSEEQLIRELTGAVPDVVLSDHGLPCFNGFEALDLIRAKGRTEIPFIFVSGAVDPQQEREGLRRGAAGWVSKSQLSELVPAIRRALGGQKPAEVPAPAAAFGSTEQQFELLAGTAIEHSLFLLDGHGRIVSWNRGAEEMFGHRADEIHGGDCARFYRPDEQELGRPRQHLQAAAASGHFKAEQWRVRKDGSQFWAEVALLALRDAAGQTSGYAHLTRDITAKMQVAEALRRSDECFQTLAQLCREAALVIQRTKVTFANQAAMELLGARSAEEIVTQPAVNFLPAIGQDGFLKRLCSLAPRPAVGDRAAAGSSRSRWFAGEVAIHRDGTKVAVEAAAAEILLRDGPAVLLLLRDLTAERRLAASVRAAHAAQTALSEQTPYPIVEVDGAGRVAAWNPAAEKLFGCTRVNALGRRFDEVAGIDTLGANELCCGGRAPKQPLKRLAHRPNREPLAIELFVAQPADATPPLFTIFIRDLTAHAGTTDSLRRCEERLRLFVDAIEDDDAIYLLDADARIVVWNAGAARLHGYSADEVCGYNISCLYTMEDAATDKPGIQLRTAMLEGRFQEHGWRMRKDGKRVAVSIVISALRNQAKELHGFVVVARELSPSPQPAQSSRISSGQLQVPGIMPIGAAGGEWWSNQRKGPARPARSEPPWNGTDNPAPLRPHMNDGSGASGTTDALRDKTGAKELSKPGVRREDGRPHPLHRALEATQATSEARRALEKLASQTRTPWGAPAVLSTTQVLELEKVLLMLELRIERHELALVDAENKLTTKNQELSRVEALLTAREGVLAAEQQKSRNDARSVSGCTPEEAAALRQLKIELQRQEEAVKRAKADLIEREAFLEQSEARLCAKIEAQQEREIELDQRAEEIQEAAARANFATRITAQAL